MAKAKTTKSKATKKSHGRHVELDHLQRGIVINVLSQRSAAMADKGGAGSIEAYKIHKVMGFLEAEGVEAHQQANSDWLKAERKKWSEIPPEDRVDVEVPNLDEARQRGKTSRFFLPKEFFKYVRNLLKDHKGWATDHKSLGWIMEVFHAFLLDDYMEGLMEEAADEDDDIDWEESDDS